MEMVSDLDKKAQANLVNENESLRKGLAQVSQMLTEVVNVRKVICEQHLNKLQKTNELPNEILNDLKKEMFNLPVKPFV